MSFYKATNQNMDRFFANHPMPTKKDIARVCELVVAVEEKVDNLESDLSANMAGLASNLIRLGGFPGGFEGRNTGHSAGSSVHARSRLLQMQEKKARISLKENPAEVRSSPE